MEEKKLVYRMYFFVPYNISEIQKGIQAGHAALRYAHQFGRFNEHAPIWDFIEDHETWIILNGGTTNTKMEVYDNKDNIRPIGSLNQIVQKFTGKNIDYATFTEPDLNNALSAICFLADERVWDHEKYPDWDGINISMPIANANEDGTINLDEPIETNVDGLTYNQWVDKIGGAKNLFLRRLVHPKNAKLA